jgi:hypothetical protein
VLAAADASRDKTTDVSKDTDVTVDLYKFSRRHLFRRLKGKYYLDWTLEESITESDFPIVVDRGDYRVCVSYNVFSVSFDEADVDTTTFLLKTDSRTYVVEHVRFLNYYIVSGLAVYNMDGILVNPRSCVLEGHPSQTTIDTSDILNVSFVQNSTVSVNLLTLVNLPLNASRVSWKERFTKHPDNVTNAFVLAVLLYRFRKLRLLDIHAPVRSALDSMYEDSNLTTKLQTTIGDVVTRKADELDKKIGMKCIARLFDANVSSSPLSGAVADYFDVQDVDYRAAHIRNMYRE